MRRGDDQGGHAAASVLVVLTLETRVTAKQNGPPAGGPFS
jgi:hypothetical protein